MWNVDAFSIPKSCGFEGTYTLLRDIPALQLVVTDEGVARAGSVLQLPKGADLQVFGEGFNERTVKVQWQERFYFVFLQDLEVSRSNMPKRKARTASTV